MTKTKYTVVRYNAGTNKNEPVSRVYIRRHAAYSRAAKMNTQTKGRPFAVLVASVPKI